MSLYNDLAATLTGSTQQFVRIVHGTQPLFTARRTKGYVLTAITTKCDSLLSWHSGRLNC
jgi:hypothetical protein